MSVKMRNDDLQSFVTNWDSVLAGLQKPPADDVLETYFHLNIVRKVRSLLGHYMSRDK